MGNAGETGPEMTGPWTKAVRKIAPLLREAWPRRGAMEDYTKEGAGRGQTGPCDGGAFGMEEAGEVDGLVGALAFRNRSKVFASLRSVGKGEMRGSLRCGAPRLRSR